LTQSLIPAATELESILVDGLEPDEIAVLKKTLDKLYANVRQPAEAETAQSA
jgi:hypothetical protein